MRHQSQVGSNKSAKFLKTFSGLEIKINTCIVSPGLYVDEQLNQTTAKGLINVQSRQKMSRETSIEPQKLTMATISPGKLVLGSNRNLSKPIESVSSNHPRPKSTTGEQDPVGDDLVAIWNFKINRLVKGKINLDKTVSSCYKRLMLTSRWVYDQDLQDLKDMLERILVLMRRVDEKNAEASGRPKKWDWLRLNMPQAQKLRESLIRLSILEDIPFGDEDGLRQRALELVKAWRTWSKEVVVAEHPNSECVT